MINIKELIEKKLEDDSEKIKRASEPLECFHASSVGYCERQIFLTKLSAKMFDNQIKGSMAIGTLIHHYIQSFPEILEHCEVEHDIILSVPNSQAYIKGRTDIMLKNGQYVWDIKSIKTLAYVLETPMREHVEQLNIYMAGANAQAGQLIYVQKSDMQTVTFNLVFDQEMLNHSFYKVSSVYEALKKWDAEGRFDKIPFARDSCYHCSTEHLHPDFKKLLKENDN